MFRALDDFLIDRVFQPIADKLADRMSPYVIARFFVTGYGLSQLIYVYEKSAYIEAVFSFIAFFGTYIYAGWLDRKPFSSSLPENRIYWLASRLIILFLNAPVLFFIFTDIPFFTRFADIGDMSFVICVYFLACRKMPPPRKSFVPAKGLATEHGASS